MEYTFFIFFIKNHSWQGKCGMNPTICVHNAGKIVKIFYYAINRITNVLLWSDQKRGQDQDDKGGFVMKSEDIVVNADGLELHQALDGPKDIKHFGCALFSR